MDTAVKPQGCTNLKLRQLSRRVTQLYDHEVGVTGLKNTQYSLLSHVVLLGPIQPSALAARMKLDASTLTRNMQPLIAQGWIRLEPGVDARSRLLVATEEGKALRTEAQRAWKRAQLSLNERLSPQRVAKLHALIDECMALLEADEATEGASDE
jgi:DNA-binding MarR family transcriptional regulator